MKLTEIREGVLIRCKECDCGKTEEGYVEGKIYFEPEPDMSEDGCGCICAYHEGSDCVLAYEVCPVCAPHLLKRQWEWNGVNPRNIKVIREGKG